MPQGNKGRYYQPVPLDFAILEALPEQGVIGGIRWAGRPIKYVRAEINKALPDGVDKLPASQVDARVRSMAFAGLVKKFGGGNDTVWARTPEGTAYLAKKEEVLG